MLLTFVCAIITCPFVYIRPSQPDVGMSSLQTTPSNQKSRAKSRKSTRSESRSTTITNDTEADLGELWIEKRVLADSSSARINNSESFDLYIDEVRFIPDNATIIKVILIQTSILDGFITDKVCLPDEQKNDSILYFMTS